MNFLRRIFKCQQESESARKARAIMQDILREEIERLRASVNKASKNAPD